MMMNPNYVLAPFDSLIAESENYVLLGLRLVAKIESFPEPTEDEKQFAFQMNLGGQNFPLDTSKNLFKKWILKKGFEELHKSIRVVLERLYVFLSVKSNIGQNINIEELQSSLTIEATNLFYDQLIKQVNDLLDEPLLLDKHILSFNNVRNCLIHTNGRLTARHCNNSTKDELVLVGRRIKMFYKNEVEEKPFVKGEPGLVNAALILGAEDFEIIFNINQEIELDMKQFIEVLNTCVFIRADIDVKLKGKCI